MARADLDGPKLNSLPALHRKCQRTFGLPDFDGGNTSALINFLSGVRDADGLSRYALAADEMLEIAVHHADSVKRQPAQLLAVLEDVVEEVNLRHREPGTAPALGPLPC